MTGGRRPARLCRLSDASHLHQCRRADQCHRLGQVPEADRRGRLCGGTGCGPSAGRGGRGHHRRQYGRGPAGRRRRHADLPQPDRGRARHRPRAGDDRQLQVGGDRGGAEMRPGQAHRELDLDEGGRGRVPRTGGQMPALRRRRGGHGLRRGRPGRHRRAQDRDLHPRLQHPGQRGRFPARGHHLRSQHLRRGDGDRGTRQLCRRLHRGCASYQSHAPICARLRRGLKRQLQLPRQ